MAYELRALLERNGLHTVRNEPGGPNCCMYPASVYTERKRSDTISLVEKKFMLAGNINQICRFKNIYFCVLILRKAVVFMVRYIGATTVLFLQMRVLNHPFGEVGCDSMIN